MPSPFTTSRNPENDQDVEFNGPADLSPLLRHSQDDTEEFDDLDKGQSQISGQDGTRQVRPSLAPPTVSSLVRRPSFLDEEDQPVASAASVQRGQKEAPVTWMSLPQKPQLAVLTIARLSEPLTERSLAAYMFYQLRSFDSSLSDSTIASQGGILTAAFAAAQFVTAVLWGRAADSPRLGRKYVLLIGLCGTTISCIGVGFAQSFGQALFFRAMAGALNGNVGVLRTMISEIIKEKKYQSRAFILLPMCFNIGVVIGPILGGFLADPIASFPSIFGPGSRIGGKTGVKWMISFPYALPNLISGIFILISALSVLLYLNETHEALRDKPDYGRKIGKFLAKLVDRRQSSYRYTQLDEHTDNANETIDLEERPRQSATNPSSGSEPSQRVQAKKGTRPGFKGIFTKNVILTLLSHHLLAFHVSTFNAMIFLLLPAPRSSNKNAHLPFAFTGGLGLTTEKVGLATAIIGVIGFPLQIMIYPSLNARLGTLKSYKVFLPFSIMAYLLLPYLSLLPNKAYLLWPCITAVLALQVLSRTFALPGQIILVNNSAPHPSVLGTIHGFAQSVSSGARTLGPILGGLVLGWGLKNNCVGAVWWAIACIAVLNWSLLFTLFEGDGGTGSK